MKAPFLIISLVLFCLSCGETNSNGHEETAKSGHTIIIDPLLTKSEIDTFKIDRTAISGKNPFYFFKDNEGICRVENDTLKVFLKEGRLTITILKLFIVNQMFDTEVLTYDCTSTSNTQYKPIKQKIQVNRKTFNVGDTLIGQLSYVGLPFFEGKSSDTDTLFMTGKFKLVIRPPNYSFDDTMIYIPNN